MKIIFSSKYDLLDKLGAGAFGTVMRCVERTTGRNYAVKLIRKDLSEEHLSEVKHEIRICRKLQHPNIVRLLENFEDKMHFYLVFDLIEGGELLHEITRRSYYSEVDASHCMQQILGAINFCHKHGIVHRDLKPDNILLVSKKPGAAIKIADFGLAIEVRGDKHSWEGQAGTMPYMAPELFREEDYGKPIDMWSIGVILFLLVVGTLPFDARDDIALINKIKAGFYKLPPDVSEEAKNVIAKMLAQNAYKRITAEQALKLPWIRQAEYVAPRAHLNETIVNLKKFNARRKFKGAIFAAVAANKLVRKRPANSLTKEEVEEGDDGRRSPKIRKVERILRENGDTPIDEESLREKIIKLTAKLVNAYEAGDAKTVERLCDPHVTSFESSDIVEGIDYRNFFPLEGYNGSKAILLNPVVHLLGNGSACIAYVRSSEYVNRNGRVQEEEAEETRVWRERNGKWKCVHYHMGLTVVF